MDFYIFTFVIRYLDILSKDKKRIGKCSIITVFLVKNRNDSNPVDVILE